jgi:hypothetical protein
VEWLKDFNQALRQVDIVPVDVIIARRAMMFILLPLKASNQR